MPVILRRAGGLGNRLVPADPAARLATGSAAYAVVGRLLGRAGKVA